ncbi:MAG: GH116 family glycosyl hydrolase, partial [Armatimonadetes bacterium]|nr:GH116 family glycosyl hydrolase [Armatimonadota bacterium]
FLFPKLERSMREADYKYNLKSSGAMPFRIQLPLGIEPSTFRPCADGQFGGVMKVYRDWKISGDTQWLRELWPSVKKSIEFAWSLENEDKWDPEKTGVLTGRQHHTLDMELFGPNSWLTGFYLGALKAGAEIAEALGEEITASEYYAIFENGKSCVDKNLFNGEYYHQLLDITDRSILQFFCDADKVYWDEEHAEIKYQIAEGCEIDQVLAQWHANLYGLGTLFDAAQVKTALKSLFKNNFRPKMRDYFNACRVFCLNDEAGLVISHWPEGVYRPMIPIPYAGETMNGYEYSAAILMIQMGLIDEGMTCVKAIRDRYDGEWRNPWNEIECGSNYARSMASYALLNAFSGFRFDMTRGMIGFNPILIKDGNFRCFWSLDSGWGEFILAGTEARLKLLHGSITLRELQLSALQTKASSSITLNSKTIGFHLNGDKIVFESPIVITSGQELIVHL